MPGFGSSPPFGAGPFGRFPWAKHVLYDTLPQYHRDVDAEAGGDLELHQQTLYPPFEALRDAIYRLGDTRDPWACRADREDTITLRLGPQVPLEGTILRRGVDGVVGSLGEFRAVTGRFTAADRGRQLRLRGASLPQNNTTRVIGAVVSAVSVVTDPPLATGDTGILAWEVRDSEGLEPGDLQVEVTEGDIGRITPGWAVNDSATNWTVVRRSRFHRPLGQTGGLTELEGSDGVITALGRFYTATSIPPRFVGAILSIQGTNKGLYRVSAIVGTGPCTVTLVEAESGAAVTLTQDAIPFHWALYPRPRLVLRGGNTLLGMAEQDGVDGVLGVGTFSALSGNWADPRDVGKYIRVVSRVNAANNCVLRITNVVAGQPLVALVSGGPTVAETGLFWEVRRTTGLGDLTQVVASAQGQLKYLAQDFGLTLDTQEEILRQRTYVGHSATWLALKGRRSGYAALGIISGFTTVAEGLWRIVQDLLSKVPPDKVVEVREETPGSFGEDGTLADVAGLTRFSAPTATFTVRDIGREIRILGAAIAGNNGLYTIERIISATTVEFRVADAATYPETNNGSLEWHVLRLYTTLQPRVPVGDDIRVGYLLAWQAVNDPTAVFGLDRFDWEPDFRATVDVQITVVGQSNKYQWFVFFTGPGNVVAQPGRWCLIDHTGKVNWLEATPFNLGVWVTAVTTLDPVAVTPPGQVAKLQYVCSPHPMPYYRPASRVLVTASPSGSWTALEHERAVERLLLRLEEVLPAHVDMVLRIHVELEAELGLEAELDYGLHYVALAAPIAAYMDLFPADLYGSAMRYSDALLRAEVEYP